MEKENKKRERSNKLLPSYYYYNEKGLIVMTEEFHINRGFCCGNGCLHCPYEPKHIKGNIELEEQFKKINNGNS